MDWKIKTLLGGIAIALIGAVIYFVVKPFSDIPFGALDVPKDKVIKLVEYTETNCSKYEVINSSSTCVKYEDTEKVKYYYLSEQMTLADKYKNYDEDISQRGKNYQIYPTGGNEYKMKVYLDEEFGGTNNFYNIKSATTTKAKYDVSNKIKDKRFGIIDIALADTTSSSVNNKDTFNDGYSSNQNTNSGNQTLLGLIDSSAAAYHTFINFTIPDGIASGDITSAKLYLYYYNRSIGTNSGKTIDCWKQTRDDWVEGNGGAGSGLTWLKYDGTNTWTTAGGDYVTTNPAGGSYEPASDDYGWWNWEIINLATDAIDNVSKSLNVMLKYNDETPEIGSRSDAYFYSKEYAVDTTKRPYLEITYTISEPSVSTIEYNVLINSSEND